MQLYAWYNYVHMCMILSFCMHAFIYNYCITVMKRIMSRSSGCRCGSQLVRSLYGYAITLYNRLQLIICCLHDSHEYRSLCKYCVYDLPRWHHWAIYSPKPIANPYPNPLPLYFSYVHVGLAQVRPNYMISHPAAKPGSQTPMLKYGRVVYGS